MGMARVHDDSTDAPEFAGRAPGRSQAGPRPPGGPADVLVGRGAPILAGRAPGRSQAGPRPPGGPADVLVGRGAPMLAGRAPGRSQAGPRPPGGPADVLVGRGAPILAGRAPGRSPAGPHPLGGSADVLVRRGAVMNVDNIDRVFGRSRLQMVTGEHVEVFREEAVPGERRRYTKRFLSSMGGDFRHWTEREWRILARLVGHGIVPVPDIVQFDRGAGGRSALVQTYDA